MRILHPDAPPARHKIQPHGRPLLRRCRSSLLFCRWPAGSRHATHSHVCMLTAAARACCSHCCRAVRVTPHVALLLGSLQQLALVQQQTRWRGPLIKAFRVNGG